MSFEHNYFCLRGSRYINYSYETSFFKYNYKIRVKNNLNSIELVVRRLAPPLAAGRLKIVEVELKFLL